MSARKGVKAATEKLDALKEEQASLTERHERAEKELQAARELERIEAGAKVRGKGGESYQDAALQREGLEKEAVALGAALESVEKDVNAAEDALRAAKKFEGRAKLARVEREHTLVLQRLKQLKDDTEQAEKKEKELRLTLYGISAEYGLERYGNAFVNASQDRLIQKLAG